MGSSSSQNQISNIDILRAVAVFSVFAHHMTAITGFRIYFFSEIGVLVGVQLFFIISGYLITQSASRYALKDYALHRFWRIFPAYWVAYLGIGIFNDQLTLAVIAQKTLPFLLNLVNFQQLNPVALIELDVLHVSWTLTIEMLWYLAAPLLLMAYRRWALVSFAVLVAVSSLWSAAAARGLLDPLFANGFAAMAKPIAPNHVDFFTKYAFPVQLMFFGIGALIYRYKEQALRISASWLLLVIFMSTVLSEHYLSDVPLYSLAPGMGPTAFYLLLLLRSKPFHVPALTYLGKISYSVYLVHFPVIIWSHDTFGHFGSWHILITGAITIALSSLVYHLIEVPCMAYARRFRAPAVGRPTPVAPQAIEVAA